MGKNDLWVAATAHATGGGPDTGVGTGVSVLGERFVVDRDPELGVVLRHSQ